MKLLSIILSIYFTGLTIVPCEDEIDKEVIDMQMVSDLDDEQQTGADLCSPFCQCHCCHVHILSFQNIPQEVIEQPVSRLIVETAQNSGTDLPYSHFQPPKV